MEDAPLDTPVLRQFLKQSGKVVSPSTKQRTQTFCSRLKGLLHPSSGPTEDEILLVTNPDGSAPMEIPKRITEDFISEFMETQPGHIQQHFRSSNNFGKDNLTKSFTSEVCLRHTFLPLFKSAFLSAEDRDNLLVASRTAQNTYDLIVEFGDVNFNRLRGFQSYENWQSEEHFNLDRIRMMTACVVHFNGCIPSAVRFISGQHTGAHRDNEAILKRLKGVVNDTTYQQLSSLLVDGAPLFCQAQFTEENFQAYRQYGNHKSTDENPEIAARLLAKDFRKGYVVMMDQRLLDCVPHLHVTPIGIAELDNPDRKERFVFDSSFRPNIRCLAINDVTSKDTEPELTFSKAFMDFLRWVWNLRITYPYEKLLVGDDDVSGAFRGGKFNPHLVGMHSFVCSNHLCMNTALTFGDSISPSIFQAFATAICELSQHLWLTKHDVVSAGQRYLPPLQLPKPAESVSTNYARANKDSLNPGVLDPQGNRLPPTFTRHVDDSIYADIPRLFPRAVCSSVLGLYGVMGEPSKFAPDVLSREKFESTYSHRRRVLGKQVDTDRMVISMLEEKRRKILDLLKGMIADDRKLYTITDLAKLIGKLVDAGQYCKWGRAQIFCLENALRKIIYQRWCVLRRTGRVKEADLTKRLRNLPSELRYRLKHLVATEQAKIIWNRRETFKLSSECKVEILALCKFLANRENKWERLIRHFVPRDPAITGACDASHLALGGHIDTIQVLFFLPYSPETRQRLEVHRNDLHINLMEFLAIILKYAATRVFLETMPNAVIRRYFPSGIPPAPILESESDNTATLSWMNGMGTASNRAQILIKLFAELLLGSYEQGSNLDQRGKHIKGELNV